MPALREFARDQLASRSERALRRRLIETERLGGGPGAPREAGSTSRSVATTTSA